MTQPFFTIGHSTHTAEDFVALLAACAKPDILVTNNATQANVIADINASKSGVTASTNGVGDLVLTSNAKGSASAVSVASSGNTLRDLGFTDVRNLGGFKDWVAAGGPVEPV